MKNIRLNATKCTISKKRSMQQKVQNKKAKIPKDEKKS